MTAIIPVNQKKCREKSMFSQLPKSVKQKHDLKKLLKKASKVVVDNKDLYEPSMDEEQKIEEEEQ